MSKNIFISCCFLLLLIACKTDSNKGLEALDLMSKGIPIKVMAPPGAEVLTEDFGVMKDVTVRKGDDFYLQILSSNAVKTDKSVIIEGQKTDVKQAPYFSKFIQEDVDGFIYEKQIDSNTVNYDFRFVKIQGDKEYMFQSGLIGNFTLDEIKKMYNAVQ